MRFHFAAAVGFAVLTSSLVEATAQGCVVVVARSFTAGQSPSAVFTNNCGQCVRFIPIMRATTPGCENLLSFPFSLGVDMPAGSSGTISFGSPGFVNCTWITEAQPAGRCPG